MKYKATIYSTKLLAVRFQFEKQLSQNPSIGNQYQLTQNSQIVNHNILLFMCAPVVHHKVVTEIVHQLVHQNCVLHSILERDDIILSLAKFSQPNLRNPML